MSRCARHSFSHKPSGLRFIKRTCWAVSSQAGRDMLYVSSLIDQADGCEARAEAGGRFQLTDWFCSGEKMSIHIEPANWLELRAGFCKWRLLSGNFHFWRSHHQSSQRIPLECQRCPLEAVGICSAGATCKVFSREQSSSFVKERASENWLGRIHFQRHPHMLQAALRY